VHVPTPGTLTVPRAIARAVQPWHPVDIAPYLAWFADEARRRVQAWDRHGGARAWFRAGLWPALWRRREGPTPPWLLRGWALSTESPAELLDALQAAPEVSPLLRARCATRAHHALGERTKAVEALATALHGTNLDPVHAAFGRLELGVAHHRLRQLDDATACYRAAESALDALGLSRGRMLALTNLAAIDHDRGHLDDARDGYRTAIAEAASLDSRRLQGIFRSNLGALLIEQGQLDDARATLRQAVRCLQDERDDRLLAITRVNQAAVELLEGHLDAADARYADALTLLGDEDPASSALCHARRGAVAALRGQLDRARQHHDRADAIVPEDDPLTVRVVELWRSLLDWAAGDRTSALGRRRAALSGTPALVSTSDEARLVVRLLERSAGEPGAALLVGPAGAWFRVPGHDRIDVARYGAAARILHQLAATAEAHPGAASDADSLIGAGWPGERILPGAAKNRLGVALARLRKLGLRDQLQKTKDGWRLDPDWSVVSLRA
jgi:tetratricopeptide (TPR) repeat protein